jgi:GTP-binding protein HflX
MIQERPTPDPSTFIGSGKLDELARECADVSADVVIFDNELTPAQLRQIEERVDRKVIDRTQLILDIFARRARTREGKWQVELAQLKYLLPRLVGSAAALSRLGGGIGTRGPGETKLETDRRRIRQRIHAISSEIDSIRQRRRHARNPPAKGVCAAGGAGGLYERGEDHLVQPAGERIGGGVQCAVRDAGPARTAGESPGQAPAARVRHRRIHRSAASHARGGLQSDAGAGGRG